ARRQSRFTVSLDTCSTPAVSSTSARRRSEARRAALPRIDDGERLEGGIDCQDVDVRRWRYRHPLVEWNRDGGAAALLVPAGPRVIDEHAAHHPCADAQGGRAILPLDVARADEPDQC